MKIAINRCYGGFGLSFEAMKMLIARNSASIQKNPYSAWGKDSSFETFDGKDRDGFKVKYENVLADKDWVYVYDDAIRTDPNLIAVIEELGSDRASGPYARVKVVEIPDDVDWEISEYDGMETIKERHRCWS